MDEATVAFSRKGLFTTSIKARDIRSREHARKLWPLVTSNSPRQIVTWVSPSFNDGQLRRRSHFRLLPRGRELKIDQLFEEEEYKRQHIKSESSEHRLAKELIAAELTRRLQAGLAMPWWFKDENASDFPLQGNLLLGSNAIVTEYWLSASFGKKFCLDIAVLGPPIRKDEMVLGGVEIELGHAFDGRKALIGRCLGFPLISIDISEMSIAEITEDWAKGALAATTRSNEQGRRQTYTYLHDLLYPLYAQIPEFIDNERRHQFIVFATDATLNQLVKWIKELKGSLDYLESEVSVSMINAKSDQSKLVLERTGEILGSNWRKINAKQCLRLTIPRPTGPSDLRAHRFHMTLARLLLSRTDALVGYKYANGVGNDKPEDDIWIHRRWIPEKSDFEVHRVLPKRLAEPLDQIMQVIDELQKPGSASAQ